MLKVVPELQMPGQGLALGSSEGSGVLIAKAIVIPPYDSPASGGVLGTITSSMSLSGVPGIAV
jgi:hypothetical protein